MNAYFEFNEELHQLLLKLDSTEDLYQSGEFDSERTRQRILLVKPCLEEVYGQELTLDEATQDATYYYFLGHQVQFQTESGVDQGFSFQAIFSNFGDLVLVGSSVLGQKISRSLFDSTAKCLGTFGFITVSDNAIFGAKYDGHLHGFREANCSWGSRFFDYI
ncbi:MAG TPA: hypothetical protein VJ654_04660 [Noviherbaspirillum sp.]|nr:hypothetical protein [Noviherbaspirillum sp.]